VSIRYKLEDLLDVLHERAPAQADAISLHRRNVEHGLVSVGLKLHCLGGGSEFATLVEKLGGAGSILEINHYKSSRASLCLVLPPVGNARAAVLLLKCIEIFTGSSVFGNPEIQMQVCSPGRLNARRSALLAIGFYLGSDTLRRYALEDFETTFTTNDVYPRGKRLVLYDAEGDFDRDFEWWVAAGGDRHVKRQLPFNTERSDLLIGSGSSLDIENINLIATLLVHVEHEGYWKQLGIQFDEDLRALLDRHLLSGLLDAPWVRTKGPQTHDDEWFKSAVQELTAYAFDETLRIKRQTCSLRNRRNQERAPDSILQEMQILLQKYRAGVVRQSRLLDDQGDSS
jgi:hypothetical protein